MKRIIIALTMLTSQGIIASDACYLKSDIIAQKTNSEFIYVGVTFTTCATPSSATVVFKTEELMQTDENRRVINVENAKNELLIIKYLLEGGYRPVSEKLFVR